MQNESWPIHWPAPTRFVYDEKQVYLLSDSVVSPEEVSTLCTPFFSLSLLTDKIFKVCIHFLAFQLKGMTKSLCRFYFLVFLKVAVMLTAIVSWMKRNLKNTHIMLTSLWVSETSEGGAGGLPKKNTLHLRPSTTAERISILRFFFEYIPNVCMCQLADVASQVLN